MTFRRCNLTFQRRNPILFQRWNLTLFQRWNLTWFQRWNLTLQQHWKWVGFPDVEINNVVSTLKIGCSTSQPKINLKTTLRAGWSAIPQNALWHSEEEFFILLNKIPVSTIQLPQWLFRASNSSKLKAFPMPNDVSKRPLGASLWIFWIYHNVPICSTVLYVLFPRTNMRWMFRVPRGWLWRRITTISFFSLVWARW